MEFIYIGTIVNTHGLKGELRIISDFEEKELVFDINKKIYLGNDKLPFTITSYRKHKNYDMVMLDGIDDIDKALFYKGEKVYIKREELPYDGVLLEEIIGYDVYVESKNIGKITNIMKSKAHPILVVNEDIYIPYVDEFIINTDKSNQKIEVLKMKGLTSED